MSEDNLGMNKKGRIEGLNEKLYSRNRYKAPEDLREPIAPVDTGDAPPKWNSPDIDTLLMSDRRKPEQYPLLKKIFYVALLFFVCAVAAAGLMYFKGDNFISTRNLDINVEGPVSIAAGSPVDLEVTITNKNNAALSEVNMTIVYPEGTRSALDASTPLLNTKEELTALGPGEKITKNERAVFLGAEGEVKTVRVSVSYKVEGSNATFTKDKMFELTIGTAPVTVSITRPDSVTSGEPFAASVSVVANSEEIIKGVILRAEYPYGWRLTNSSPEAQTSDGNVWFLGDLSPGDKKTVTLNGILLGEDDEERTFRFFVGVGGQAGGVIETALSQASMVVSLSRPEIALDVKLNNSPSVEYIAPAGGQVQGAITIKNNLPENLLSPQIEVKLSGNALDRLSITPHGGGFYNSANSTIFWNQSNSDELSRLSPGDTRTVTFSFASEEDLPPGAANQKIDLSISFSGRSQNAASGIRVTEARTVKIASEIALSSRSLYSRGPFTNSGPIPPEAESETTYTVALTLGNTQNDIKNAKVVGTLGANVRWIGETSPDESGLSYDDSSRAVTWDVETLPSGAGFSAPAKEVFFRVSLTPSLGQVGGTPVLLGNIVFTGTDAFTNAPVRVTNQAVTTRTNTDPSYVQGDETVVK